MFLLTILATAQAFYGWPQGNSNLLNTMRSCNFSNLDELGTLLDQYGNYHQAHQGCQGGNCPCRQMAGAQDYWAMANNPVNINLPSCNNQSLTVPYHSAMALEQWRQQHAPNVVILTKERKKKKKGSNGKKLAKKVKRKVKKLVKKIKGTSTSSAAASVSSSSSSDSDMVTTVLNTTTQPSVAQPTNSCSCNRQVASPSVPDPILLNIRRQLANQQQALQWWSIQQQMRLAQMRWLQASMATQAALSQGSGYGPNGLGGATGSNSFGASAYDGFGGTAGNNGFGGASGYDGSGGYSGGGYNPSSNGFGDGSYGGYDGSNYSSSNYGSNGGYDPSSDGASAPGRRRRLRRSIRDDDQDSWEARRQARLRRERERRREEARAVERRLNEQRLRQTLNPPVIPVEADTGPFNNPLQQRLDQDFERSRAPCNNERTEESHTKLADFFRLNRPSKRRRSTTVIRKPNRVKMDTIFPYFPSAPSEEAEPKRKPVRRESRQWQPIYVSQSQQPTYAPQQPSYSPQTSQPRYVEPPRHVEQPRNVEPSRPVQPRYAEPPNNGRGGGGRWVVEQA